MADGRGTDEEERTRAIEAAERAGSIVTDHVRSIIDAAQARARETELEADQEAERVTTEASETAGRVLERIGSLEDGLGSLVNDLRTEAGRASDDVDRQT